MLLALIIARPSDMNLVIGLETPALRAALTEMGAEYQESGAKVELVEVEDLMHSITLQRLDAARDASEGPAYDRYTLDMLKIAVPYTRN